MISSLADRIGGDSPVRSSGVVKNLQSRKVLIVFLCILFAGIFLRFYSLGHILAYDDEPLHQLRVSYQPFPVVAAHYNGSALFTFLVHFLIRLGDIVFMARLLSALSGAITIIMVYVLGKALFSKREGLIAAGLAALSPFLIRYSQYSRAYALFAMLSLLSLYFFDKAQQENRTPSWIFYTAFTALNIFTHLVALLILPAYIFFMVLTAGGKGREGNPAALRQGGRLKKFILWTSLVCVLAACFYLPSLQIKEFLAGSARRALSQPSDVRLSPLLIHDILLAQWRPPSILFYVLFLACLGLGIAAGLRSRRRSVGLSLLYVAVPYMIFVLIKPRDVNVLSADRYFIFILPVLLLFMARGITALGSVLTVGVSRLGLPKTIGQSIRGVIQVSFLLLITAGLLASFKNYYLEYWRLGSLKIENDVAAYLKKEVKGDALVYFDVWPTSSLNTLVNPLTRDLRPDQLEFMIRDGFAAAAPENDFIVFRVGPLMFQEFVAGRTVDLWAVARLDPETTASLVAEAKNRPGVDVRILKRHVILHIQNNDEPVAQKTAEMARLFLSLPLKKMRAQQYRLTAAKAALMVYGPEEAYKDLEAYRAVVMAADEIKEIPSPPVFRLFDRLLGLSPSTLYSRVQSRDLAEIGRLLYLRANFFLREDDLDHAREAYQKSLELTKDFDFRISEKLAFLAEKMAARGRREESLALFRQASDLSPAREDFHFRLAETYREEGSAGLAEQEYKKMFGVASLPDRFLQRLSENPQIITAWENAGLWHLIFRAEEQTIFSGTMTAPKIAQVKKTGFEAADSLRISRHSLAFSVAVKKGAVKALSFKLPKKGEPVFDIDVNGQPAADKLIILKR
jgi:tetratricopeptide (TPR) repeat protein